MTDLIFSESNKTNRHIWACQNELGGVHIWAQLYQHSNLSEQYYGGIEVHSPKPLYDPTEPHSHDSCWLIGGPCWHDGSGLAFEDHVLPLIRELGTENILQHLKPILIKWHKLYFGDQS